jgi:hypothetical protein
MPERVVQLEPGEDAVIIAPPGQTFTYHDPATGYWVYRNKAKTRTRLFAAIGGEPEPPPPLPDPEPEPPEPPVPPTGIAVTPTTIASMLAAARPGDEFLAKAGTYGVFKPPNGDVRGRITIRFEPGAVVDGKGARQFGNWVGVHDLTLEGLTLKGFRPDGTGVLSMTGCERLVFIRPSISGCFSPRQTDFHQDHGFYFRGGRDIEVDDPEFHGGWPNSQYLHGGGIHVYRDTPVNIHVHRGSVTGFDYGLMLHAAGSGNSVSGTDLAGNRYGGSHSRVDAGWTVRP